MNAYEGLALVIAAAFIWGSYGGFVKRFATAAPYLGFMCAFQLAQVVITLVVVLPRYEKLQFSDDIYPHKYAMLILSGVFMMGSEFLFVASTKTLSSVSSTLILDSIPNLGVSVLISQLIDGHGVNVYGLLISSFLYCIGLILFAKADFESEKRCIAMDEENLRSARVRRKQRVTQRQLEIVRILTESQMNTSFRVEQNSDFHYPINVEERPFEESKVDMEAEMIESPQNSKDFNSVNALDQSKEENDDTNDISVDNSAVDTHEDFKYENIANKHLNSRRKDSVESFTGRFRRTSLDILGHHRTLFRGASYLSISGMIRSYLTTSTGIFLALASSVMLGCFTITSAIAMTGENAVTGWETAFLLNQSGQLVTLPVLGVFLGVWDPFDIFPSEEKISSITQLFTLSSQECLVACLAGGFVCMGYVLLYAATASVPFAIIDGLLAGETLISYLFAFFVWDEFRSPSLFSKIGICTTCGIFVYVAAVTVILVYANNSV